MISFLYEILFFQATIAPNIYMLGGWENSPKIINLEFNVIEKKWTYGPNLTTPRLVKGI